MIRVLLLCAMLFQTAPQPALKPVLQNDRVTVWDLTDLTTARPVDAVVLSLSGSASFLPKGATARIAGRSIVIDLKDHPVTPIANTSGYPLAYPRSGAKKLLENERVIVWDYSWTPGVATPMHFHDKDMVLVFLGDGDLRSTGPDGQVVVFQNSFGKVNFGPRGRTHSETLIRGTQRAIVTELK
jgi:hypothetical protein